MQEIICDLCGANHQIAEYLGDENAKNQFEEGANYRITEENFRPPKRIVKCVQCGLIFAPYTNQGRELASFYREMVDEQYVQEERCRRITARTILRKLKRFIPGNATILDVGCSTGFLLDEARKIGWKAYGVEVAQWAVKYARQKFGLDVCNKSLEEANFKRDFFDVVILQDVIEHLPDPKRTLLEIRRILKPTGILYVNTPDIDSLASRILKARWWGIKQFHLYYFTKKTLKKMLTLAGFKQVKVTTYCRNFTLKYLLLQFKKYNVTLYKLAFFLSNLFKMDNLVIKFDLKDQIEIFACRKRGLEYLSEIEDASVQAVKGKLKTVVVLPAYNAAKTVRATYDDIPKQIIDEIILVDDASKDETVSLAKKMGMTVIEHKRNKGYGANQKTCYREAIKRGADIVVMVHPDYQYDPCVIPDLIAPLKAGRADAVFGSRMLKGGALIGGMPVWKHNVNIVLTALANIVLKTYLTEYHSGFRAYSAKFLKSVRFDDNSDDFVFDFEIIVQAVCHYLRIEEVPIRTRYFDEASTIKFWPAVLYGLGILKTLFKHRLYEWGWVRFRQFE
ncbi:MAG: methyltransferase domain-containing protein [Candidatus Omnitrophica bacterium]|nr:methyltransferase domain-containing protein [Candidatus Omnitrophota bacterium]MBU1924956.1 methyltransferase domain-containing protein [Candidatus Omnitrophota bacterium]